MIFRDESLWTLSLLALVFLITSGCGSTDRLLLSENLSSEFQLKVNTAEQYETSFNFNPNPNAEKIIAEDQRTGSAAKVQYSLNGPLEGRLTSLVRSKFGSVSESSDNKITFSVEDVSARSVDGTHSIEVTALVEIEREGETYTRRIARSTSTPIKPVTGNVQNQVTLDKETLDEFVMQFVVATDSFIDSNYGVD